MLHKITQLTKPNLVTFQRFAAFSLTFTFVPGVKKPAEAGFFTIN